VKYLHKEVSTKSGAPASAWRAKKLVANLMTDICHINLHGFYSPEAMVEGYPSMGEECETIENFLSLESYPDFFNECVFKVCVTPGGFLADAELQIDNRGRAFLRKSVLQPSGSSASCWRANSLYIDVYTEEITIKFNGYYSQQAYEQDRDPMAYDVPLVISEGFSSFDTHEALYGELVARIINGNEGLSGAVLSEIFPSSSSSSSSSSLSSSSSSSSSLSSYSSSNSSLSSSSSSSSSGI
jgi:hypothetical protein